MPKHVFFFYVSVLSSHGIIHPLFNWCITTTAGKRNLTLTVFLSLYLALRVDRNTEGHAASTIMNIVLIN